MDKRTKGIVTVGVLMIIVMVAVIIGVVVKRAGNISSGGGGISGTKQDMTLDEMYNELDVEQATPVKGTVTLDTPDLYDELPEIDKYPLSVEGSGDVDIEIFTSGEKAGKDNDSWLIDVASSFNSSDVKTSDGKTVSMSVRSVPSGTAADYIISGKYLPDLYTPSNTLFGEYAISNNGSLTLEIWGSAANTYSVALEVPGGEYVERVSPRYDKSTVIKPIFGGGTVYVDYFLIEDAAGQELIMLRFIRPANGIWGIRVYGVGETELSFNAWLPISAFVSPQTKFVKSDPRTTITSPASAETAICACAYDYTNGNLYIDNSRGYTADRRVKPDFLAPGVNISGDGPGNETVIRSGTSIAAAYAAGCSILLLEWSYDRMDVRTINGNQIRHYLIRGAVRPGASGGLLDIRSYPNPEWGYGLLNIYNTFESLRNV